MLLKSVRVSLSVTLQLLAMRMTGSTSSQVRLLKPFDSMTNALSQRPSGLRNNPDRWDLYRQDSEVSCHPYIDHTPDVPHLPRTRTGCDRASGRSASGYGVYRHARNARRRDRSPQDRPSPGILQFALFPCERFGSGRERRVNVLAAFFVVSVDLQIDDVGYVPDSLRQKPPLKSGFPAWTPYWKVHSGTAAQAATFSRSSARHPPRPPRPPARAPQERRLVRAAGARRLGRCTQRRYDQSAVGRTGAARLRIGRAAAALGGSRN